MKHVLAVVAGAIALAGMSAQAEIRLGVLYPIAGTGAVYGVPAMFGHDLAVDEINAAGGVLGQQLATFKRDTKLKPAAAAAAAKELITKDEVNVLIGGLSSAVGLAISEVARQEKVVYIATIPKTIQMTTTKLHDHVFRTASHTDFEGDAMAQIVAQLGIKKLCDIQLDYAYGHDLGAGIVRALARHAPDTELVIELRPKLGATDYNAFISQILGAGCDGITSGLWGSHFVNFAQQAKPFGLFEQAKYISGGEIASHEIAGKMGEDYPDNVWSNTYELWYDHHDPSHVEFQHGGGREGRDQRDRDVAGARLHRRQVLRGGRGEGGLDRARRDRGGPQGAQHRHPGGAAHHQCRRPSGRYRTVLGADGEEGRGRLPGDGAHHLHSGRDRGVAGPASGGNPHRRLGQRGPVRVSF